jgi:phospholipase C
MMVHALRTAAVLGTVLVSAAAFAAASRTGTAPAGAQAAGFKHVIVIVQENRTPDNLFQGLCVPPYGSASTCSTTPSATQYDIKTSAWLDKFAPGGTIAPKPVPLANTYDLNHAHSGFLAQCDADPGTTVCKMDGRARCSGTCPPDSQFLYVDNSTGTVNPYLTLATQYGWANFMFQTNQGPSYPAHQILFGGTSAASASDDAAGIFASENMIGTGGIGGFKKIAGCTAPSTTQVEVINPTGPPTRVYPCFEHQTMADLFTGSVTWRYYAPAPGTIWTAPNSIKHICQSTGPGGKCVGPIWTSHLDFHPPDVLKDIASCNLRSVSWVIPAGIYSDHAGLHSGSGGPAWVASIVNAIGQSTSCDGGKGYWNDTAVIITWDDWGGWYDHVAPTFLPMPQGDYQYGFRVPLVVVSAYTPRGYINNVPHDFGTILRFIQHNFAIPEGALHFADSRAKGDLTAFFNFSQPARAFQTISAPAISASVENDTSPPDND